MEHYVQSLNLNKGQVMQMVHYLFMNRTVFCVLKSSKIQETEKASIFYAEVQGTNQLISIICSKFKFQYLL